MRKFSGLDFRKKVSFYLALVMLFGSVMPGPVAMRVQAAPLAAGTNFPDWTGTAVNMLRVEAGNLFTNPFGNVERNAAAPVNEDVLLAWEVLPTFSGLHVLRHFVPTSPTNVDARRVELYVMGLGQDDPLGGPTLTVGFDVFERVGAGYRSVADPARNQPPAFIVEIAQGSDETVNEAFFTSNPGTVRDQGVWGSNETQAVNNRSRWPLPIVPGPPGGGGGGITPYDPGFFDFAGTPNYNYDPGDPTATPPVPPPGPVPADPASHYRFITPGFQVQQGGGATFEFDGIRVSFMWDGTDFFVYYQNIWDGFVFEFELETYSSAQILDYFIVDEWWSQPWVADRPYVNAQSQRAFVLNGLSGFTSVPYAHVECDFGPGHGNAAPGGAPAELGGWRRHTHPEMEPLLGDPAEPMLVPNYVFGGVGASVGATVTREQLYSGLMLRHYDPDDPRRAVNDEHQPTALYPGLILMFHMPVMFDEVTDGYTDFESLGTRALGGPNNAIIATVNLVRQGHLPVNISVRLSDDVAPPPAHPNIESVGTIVRGAPDNRRFVTIDVINLDPGILFDDATLTMAGDGTWNINPPAGEQFVLRNHGVPISMPPPGTYVYTFMEYEIDITEDDIREIWVLEPYDISARGVDIAHYELGHIVHPPPPPDGIGSHTDVHTTAQIYGTLGGGGAGYVPYTTGDRVWLRLAINESDDPLQAAILMFRFATGGVENLTGSHPNVVWSQQVYYAPYPITPNIPRPTDLIVTNERMTAVPPDMNNPVIDFNQAVLYFGVDWHMGTADQFLAMLGHARELAAAAGAPPPDYIEVDYVIRLAEHPQEDDYEYVLEDYRNFVGVRARVFGVPGPPADPTGIRIEFSIHRVEDTNPPVDEDGQVRPVLGQEMTAAADNLWLTRNVLEGPGGTGLSGGTAIRPNLGFATHVQHRAHTGPDLFNPLWFEFPGLYSMYVRGLEWSAPGQGVLGERSLWFRTISDSLTLSELERPLIPPPVDLRVWPVVAPDASDAVRPVDRGSALNVEYTVPMSAIIGNMRTFFGQNSAALVTTNLYIGMFEREMRETFFPYAGQLPPDQRDAAVTSVQYQTAWNGLIPLTTGQAAALRGGAVLRIENIPVIHETIGHALDERFRNQGSLDSALAGDPIPDPNMDALAVSNSLHTPRMALTVQGLDENASYFMIADLRLAVYMHTSPAGLAPPEPHELRRVSIPDLEPPYSPLSGMDGATTVGIVLPPGPGDIVPPAPGNFTAEEFPDRSTNVLAGWDSVDSPPGTGIIVAYELLRGQRRLSVAEMRTRVLDVIDFADSLSPDMYVVMRTTGAALQIREPSTRNWLAPDPGDFTFSAPMLGGNRYQLMDYTTFPNQVYFYYIRTVFYVQVNGQWVRNVSYWVEDTVTTSTTPPLHSLRDEGAGPDPFTTRVVSFEHDEMAMLWAGVLANPQVFRLEYELRTDGGEWVRSAMNRALLEERVNPARRYYTLMGLMPGTYYEMRARVHHIETGDTSLWSNIIVFITGDDDDDLGRDANNWLQHIRLRLQHLLDRPYWLAQDTPADSIVVYRGGVDVFRGLVLENAGRSHIPLRNAGSAGPYNLTYFMPLGLMQFADTSRMGFSSDFGELEFLLPPSFISFAHNQAMLDSMRVLNTNSAYLDMFVKLEFELRPFTEIGGSPMASRQASLYASAVMSNTNLSAWDASILVRAYTMVMAQLADPILLASIVQLLQDEATNEEIWLIVEQLVEAVDRQIQALVRSELHSAPGGILTDTVRDIPNFDASPMLAFLGSQPDMSVSAHTLHPSGWVRADTVELARGPAVPMRSAGTVAFTGTIIVMPGSAEMAWGATMVAVVAAFGLEDMFGPDVNPHQNASRRMVAGSAARIAGAPGAADPIAWGAANLNVQFSNRNPDALLQKQEAIAIVMALYERRTNTRVSQIVIRDTQATAGMSLDPRYSQAVRAAFELGFVTDRNINPQGAITVGEFLEILAEFRQRVRL